MSEEVEKAVAEVQAAFQSGDMQRLHTAADSLFRATRTTADYEARAAYEEHSAEHTCGYWLDN